MQEKLEQLAAAMGVTTADVEFFLQLTATQVKSGKEGIEAIQAAFDTAKKLCHSAFYSIRAHDPTNPYGHRDTFLPAVYGLLTAS